MKISISPLPVPHRAKHYGGVRHSRDVAQGPRGSRRDRREALLLPSAERLRRATGSKRADEE